MTFHTTIQQLDVGNALLGAERIKSARNQNDHAALKLEAARRQVPFARLPAEQQEAVRRQTEAVGWLAGTVLDAAPELRPARYKDALEQARAMGIPVDNLPPAYHPGLDPLLRQYREEAKSLLGQIGTQATE